MNKISNKLKSPIFDDNKRTLSEVSLDNSDKNNPIEMVDETYVYSKDMVIDFDAVKTDFCKEFCKSDEVFKSADALFFDDKKNKLIFVEFKNGKVKAIKEKLKDSLLVFSNIIGVNLKFCRKYCEYIVVYNYEVNKAYIKQQERERLKREDEEKNQSVDKEYIGLANTLRSYSGDELVLWNLGFMKGICVSDVHTYSADEFKKYYSKNHI